jgi:trigger factor
LKVEYAEESSVRKSLSFEVEAELVEQELESRARELGRKVKLPGFRAGKVPAAVIRKRFRESLHEEAAEALINRLVVPELEGRGHKPVASPRVTDLKMDDQAPMTFKVVIETLPLIELPEWRGLPARARSAEVSEEALEKELEGLREQHARFEPVEGRPVQEGDHALCDVTWKPAGGGKGGRNEDALIEVGPETNPALREALLGMSPGETRQATYQPEAAEAEGGAEGGKPRAVEYTLTLKAIRTKLLPALDDELAKDLGEFESLDELRQDLRRRLREAEERRVDREVKSQLVAELCKRASFEVPEALVERHMNARTEEAARSLALRGIDPSKASVDWKLFRDGQREQALEAAKADILLDEIARRESVEVPEHELEAELGRYARAMRKPVEVVRAQMQKEGELQALRARMREERTLDLIKSSARLEQA